MSVERFGTGFQPAVGSVTIIRRQMLSHFPTVTKSTGFQPEPLLITHHSPLIAESGTGFQQADNAITSSPETASLVTESIGFQPKPWQFNGVCVGGKTAGATDKPCEKERPERYEWE